MNYRHLLLLALCIHFSASCVPVRPGEDMPCPSVPQASMADGYNVKPLVKKANENGAMVYGCNPPEKMLSVSGTTPTVLPDAEAKISCQPNSGIFTDSKGMAVGSKTYACGTEKLPCQTCDMSKILETSNGACSQEDVFCTAKPTVTPDAGMCPTMSCAADSLYILTSATTAMEVADSLEVKCDAGVWKYDAAGTALPATAIGFVCAKPASCEDPTTNCKAAVADAFNGVNPMDLRPTQAKPSCGYECPAGEKLTLMGAVHDRVVCAMDTGKLTLDSAGGPAYDPTNNKFDCIACGCTPGPLTDGAGGLCNGDTEVCVQPTALTVCDGTCPDGSSAIYLDAAGMKKTATGTAISCAGNEWIAAGSTDVTCAYSQTGTLPMVPPTVQMPCAALTAFTTPCANAADCDFSKLIYLPFMGGYQVMCSKGDLVTDSAFTGIAVCMPDGTWQGPITQANCIQTAAPANDCFALMTMAGGAANVNVNCKFNRCTMTCAAAGQKFDYTLDDGSGSTAQSPTLLCFGGEPTTPTMAPPIVASSIKCVV